MLAPQPQIAPQSMEMDAVGMDHLATRAALPRKRKAESLPENNERLSKRLSLLNLEQNGPKLYVHVENPLAASAASAPSEDAQPAVSLSSLPPNRCGPNAAPPDSSDELMPVDESKYKVYIYNIDEELSSDSEPEDSNNGKLVFLQDIEKHLKANRIPPQVLTDPRAEMAGKELVLYSIPRSISVPQEMDSVRKAIIESRKRARERQAEARMPSVPEDAPLADLAIGQHAGSMPPSYVPYDVSPTALLETPMGLVNGTSSPNPQGFVAQPDGVDSAADGDAMELD